MTDREMDELAKTIFFLCLGAVGIMLLISKIAQWIFE